MVKNQKKWKIKIPFEDLDSYLAPHRDQMSLKDKVQPTITYKVITKDRKEKTSTIETTDEQRRKKKLVELQAKELLNAARKPYITFKKPPGLNHPTFVTEAPLATWAETKALDKGKPLPVFSDYL